MKIVFVSYLHGFGGAEKQNIMLANAMAERGHDVTLVSISANNICYQLDNRVRYIFLQDRKKNVLRLLTRYNDLKKVLEEIKPDVIINFWFQSAYLTALMKKSITGKVIYSERGDPGDSEYSGVLGIIRTLTLPRIDGFVFQSKGAQDFFDDSVKKRSTVIPNPVFIDHKGNYKVGERRKSIVTVGRLHPQKNQKLLIDAFKLIADEITGYNLEIYGDGELKVQLQKHIDDEKLTDRVFLKGTSKQIDKVILDSSLFVLSSDYEGLPNTLLEAMALGIPCVSTDCRPGGAREIIDDGVDGFIVPVGDKYKLAKQMIVLLENHQLREEFSAVAIKKMRRFSPKVIYDEWEKYIKEYSMN